MKIKKSFFAGWVIKTMLFVFALFLSDFLLAQSTITGTVSDNNGNHLSNVSVTIKGKTVGTFTNNDGKFSIPASVNDVIIFSSVDTGLFSDEAGND
ncbi:MAG: carboxypeptidase-like regulatory domain-containing protein [Chitinophagaceae bacterium]